VVEVRRSRWIGLWAIAGLIACASGAGPPEPDATDATASAPIEDAPAAPTADEEAWSGDPDVPEDSPYADLRARLEQQRGAGDTTDPLAPLRGSLERQAQQQIEAQRWDRTRPPAPQASASDSTPDDPALSQIAEEIAADEELRQRSEQEKRLREQRKREVEAQVREARFEMFAQLPLRGCVPSARHMEKIPGDIVRHRQLQREDFRADEMSQLPTGVLDADIEPGAHVAVSLACVTTIRVVETGPDAFEARLEGLRFVALLNRDKSWWNEEGDHISEEWTLRHEQVHFDLAEVEARRLTREAGEVTSRLIGRGTAPEAAAIALQQLWDAHFEQLKTAFLEMEMRYDRETRHGRNLSKQTEWFARAKRGLSGPQPATGG
jgi:hypothetical protein